jgi:integrase
MQQDPKRHRSAFHSTRHRGLSFRLREDGSKAFYGYLPSRGRTQLKATGEREAVAEFGQLRGKAAKGELTDLRAAKRTVEQIGNEYLNDAESGLKRGREHRRQFRHAIVPRLGHRQIGSVSPHDLLKLDRDLRAQGLAEATAANYLKPLRGTFEYAALKYGISNPFRQVPRNRLASCNRTRPHREWTSEEVVNLIEAGHRLDARKASRAEYGLLIETLIRTGGRLGEVLGMRYADLDLSEGLWRVSGQWSKQGEYVESLKTEASQRRVPLSPSLVKKLAARKLAKGAGDDAFVFAGANGNPPSHSNFRKRGWGLAVKNAGLTDGPKLTPHDARHGFASQMADLGLTSSDVAQVLGHSTAGVTEKIYTHVWNREAREQRIREAMEAAGAAS